MSGLFVNASLDSSLLYREIIILLSSDISASLPLTRIDISFSSCVLFSFSLANPFSKRLNSFSGTVLAARLLDSQALDSKAHLRLDSKAHLRLKLYIRSYQPAAAVFTVLFMLSAASTVFNGLINDNIST